MNKFFLDLGLQPLANEYLKYYKKDQTKYRLKLYFNTKTKIVSISKRIPSNKMFDNKYPYRSSMSKTMQNSFRKLSLEIKKKFNPKIFLEIGSNDGALIKNFKKKCAIGVEPCSNLAKITTKKGYKTYSEYWNLKLAQKIIRKHGKVDLIYSANTITHISDLNNVFRSISKVLTNNGIFIIEDPSLLECVKKSSYDQFYNEHIYVFSIIGIKNILSKFDFEIFDVKNINTHGGSLRYYIKRKNNSKIKIKNTVIKQISKEKNYGLDKFKIFEQFSKNVLDSKKKLLLMLKKLKIKNKKIIGYGATAKATTVLNYCNIDNDYIDYFIDTTPDKTNKFMPGKKIKILKYNKKLMRKIDYVFLGAWNFKKEILNKEKKFKHSGGKFITHIPKPYIF